MALQVWLPLTKDLRNQGLANITSLSLVSGNSLTSGGKVGGQCLALTKLQTILENSSCMSNKKQISYAYWIKVNTAWSANWLDGIRWTSSNGTTNSITRQEFYTNCTRVGTWFPSSSTNSISGKDFTPEVWTHLAATLDYSTGDVNFYINGVLQGHVTTLDTTYYCRGDFYIGDNGVDVNMNDVRIYDHCLSSMEVKELSKGLMLHYPLNRNGWGQENLLPGTNLGTTSWNWTMQAGNYTTAEETTLSGVRGCKFTRGTTAQSGWSVIFYNNINESLFKASTKYKLSVDIYPSVNTNFVVSIRESNGTNVFANAAPAKAVTANKWNHLEFDLTTVATLPSSTGETIYFQSMDSSTGVSYIFRNLKLEEGEIATPWCPNSSDILATTMGLNGTTEYDISGFCNNGIRYGTFNFNSETPKYAVSTQYNGTDNTLKIPFDASVWPDNFTMSIWFRKDELGSKSYETLFGGPSGFEMDTRSGAATTLSLYMASVRGGNVYTGFEFGKWYMVTLVNDGVNELYYINGDLVKTIEKKSMPVGTYYIGSWQTANKQNYMGLLSDARIYATALSASDIKSLYQNCATIDVDGTIHGQIRS